MKVLCVIPALPNEVKVETLTSVFNQTIPVHDVLLLTEAAPKQLTFPAKISWVLNRMLQYIKLDAFDYLLRVDGDVFLPNNFVEANIALNQDAVGAGYAQLIKTAPFIKLMGGKFHPEHDDGYIIEKFCASGYKASWVYSVKPVLRRQPGLHQGSAWYVAQGELKYCYGEEPIELTLYLLKHWCPFTIWELCGYFKALLTFKKRFDIADIRLNKRLRKYREPKRLLKLPNYLIRVIKGYNLE